VKAIIAKRAQERILFESRTEWLRFESAYAPSQTRAPFTTTVAVTSTRVPRHEEGAIKIKKSSRMRKRDKRCCVFVLFVIWEEWLDGIRMGQGTIERIECVKAMFGATNGQSIVVVVVVVIIVIFDIVGNLDRGRGRDGRRCLLYAMANHLVATPITRKKKRKSVEGVGWVEPGRRQGGVACLLSFGKKKSARHRLSLAREPLPRKVVSR
jgi:hypothetical protein